MVAVKPFGGEKIDPSGWRRVLVIGCSGAGKSTLSRHLAAATGLPLIHLDQHYHRPGWVEPTQEAWRSTVEKLIAGDRWIIDGSYTGTLALRASRADAIIYLDLPPWRCLTRVLWRIIRYYGRVRPDAAPGCPERFDWSFLKYVMNYRKRFGPRIERILADFAEGGGEVVWLRTIYQIDRLIQQIERVGN